MSSFGSNPSTSLEAVRRIDEACDRFEELLQRGDRPRIEGFLDAEPEPSRDSLLQALLDVELEYRRAWGEQPRADEYLARFPERRETVQAAFDGAAEPPLLAACSEDLRLLQMALVNASGRRADRLRVYYRGELVHTTLLCGVLELGRQRQGEAPPFAVIEGPETNRLVVAPLEETTVSRHHAMLLPEGDDAVRVTNLSQVNPILFPNGRRLQTGQSAAFPLTLEMTLGALFVRIDRPTAEPDASNEPHELASSEDATASRSVAEARNFFDLLWRRRK